MLLAMQSAWVLLSICLPAHCGCADAPGLAHEALVRSPQGEGAASVLAQVNELNRYRVRPGLRVKAIEGRKSWA